MFCPLKVRLNTVSDNCDVTANMTIMVINMSGRSKLFAIYRALEDQLAIIWDVVRSDLYERGERDD